MSDGVPSLHERLEHLQQVQLELLIPFVPCFFVFKGWTGLQILLLKMEDPRNNFLLNAEGEEVEVFDDEQQPLRAQTAGLLLVIKQVMEESQVPRADLQSQFYGLAHHGVLELDEEAVAKDLEHYLLSGDVGDRAQLVVGHVPALCELPLVELD